MNAKLDSLYGSNNDSYEEQRKQEESGALLKVQGDVADANNLLYPADRYGCNL